MSTSVFHKTPDTPADVAASLQRLEGGLQDRLDQKSKEAGPRPRDWRKPPYGTPDYRHAHACGWIGDEEAEDDRKSYLERRERSLASLGCPGAPDPREGRPAPRESRQYARSMSTKAMTDDRLTPQGKALLSVIVAFCGKRRHCDATKSLLGQWIARSSRSILRYLDQLRHYGYVRTETRRNKLGMDIGLRIWIVVEEVLPFFARDGKLAEWLLETERTSGKQGRTTLSSINDLPQNLLFFPSLKRQKQLKFSP